MVWFIFAVLIFIIAYLWIIRNDYKWRNSPYYIRGYKSGYGGFNYYLHMPERTTHEEWEQWEDGFFAGLSQRQKEQD